MCLVTSVKGSRKNKTHLEETDNHTNDTITPKPAGKDLVKRPIRKVIFDDHGDIS